jgi:hypothetical protein
MPPSEASSGSVRVAVSTVSWLVIHVPASGDPVVPPAPPVATLDAMLVGESRGVLGRTELRDPASSSTESELASVNSTLGKLAALDESALAAGTDD